MDAKIAKYSLGVFILAIFFFVGTFSWFMLFKERVCAQNLYSPNCYESYAAFLHNEANRI